MLVQKEGPGYGASVAREESANTMMLGAIRSKTITEIRRETPTHKSAIESSSRQLGAVSHTRK